MKSPIALALVLGLIGFLPLMGGPRYEAGLVAGLIAPLWVGVASALSTARSGVLIRQQTQADNVRRFLGGDRVVVDTLIVASLHVLAIVLVALLHGLRVGFCEPGLGFALIFLGPAMGAVLSSLIGAASALTFLSVFGTRGGALGIGVTSAVAGSLFPIGSAVIRLFGFYESPAVFAYDPFVGYFAGPLYDTVQYDLSRLLSFRLGTLFSVLAIVSCMAVVILRASKSSGLRLRAQETSPRRSWALLCGFVFGLGSVAHGFFAEDLGHSHTAAGIQKVLGQKTVAGRCTIYFPAGVERRTARLLAQECVGHLVQLESYFAVEAPENIDVYVFANSEQKRLLMGAAKTYIAKPWRREVYIQPGSFPHQVLGHELAHVVTGEFGTGPFKVAGPFGGFLPDPGRIEGFAVAAAPREHSDGTLHQWTAAMRSLELLPRVERLFQLSFLQSAPARSYTAAGSFIDFVHENHGPDNLKLWYGGADLEELTGQTWQKLEEDWHAFLDGVEVPPAVLEISKPRFSRPGVFERRCPHAVDRAVAGALVACPVQEKKARTLVERAVSLDPLRADVEMGLPRCALHAGNAERSITEATSLVSNEERYSPGARRSGYDFLGNTLWNESKHTESKAAFKSALALTYGRDSRRQLDVKLWALAQPEAVREPVRMLLAPAVEEERAPLLALSHWYETGPDQDVAAYLLARVALSAGRLSEAAAFMSAVKSKKLPLPALRREAARTNLMISCRQRLLGKSKKQLDEALARYMSHDLEKAEKFEAKRLSERCETAALRKRASSGTLKP